MSTRAERISEVLRAIAIDMKANKLAVGDLSALTTTKKDNIVNAVNELASLAKQPQGAQIDDTATSGATNVVWSADKVYDTILSAQNTVKDQLTNGAGAALDTLKELADALDNNPSFAADIASSLTKRVRVDAAQTFTVAEKKQACDNLGLGDPDYDFLAAYNASKA